MKRYRRLISIDFDGVLHAYDGNWTGDPSYLLNPVPGSIPWLYDLLVADTYDVAVFSSRSADDLGNRYDESIRYMQLWLHDHLLKEEERRGWPGVYPGGATQWKVVVDEIIKWPTHKPPAFLHIDDRAYRYEGPGTLPDINTLGELDAWWKKGASDG